MIQEDFIKFFSSTQVFLILLALTLLILIFAKSKKSSKLSKK